MKQTDHKSQFALPAHIRERLESRIAEEGQAALAYNAGIHISGLPQLLDDRFDIMNPLGPAELPSGGSDEPELNRRRAVVRELTRLALYIDVSPEELCMARGFSGYQREISIVKESVEKERRYKESLILDTPEFREFRERLATAVGEEGLEAFSRKVGIETYAIGEMLKGTFRWVKDNKPYWGGFDRSLERDEHHPRNELIHGWVFVSVVVADALQLEPESVCNAIGLVLTEMVKKFIREQIAQLRLLRK